MTFGKQRAFLILAGIVVVLTTQANVQSTKLEVSIPDQVSVAANKSLETFRALAAGPEDTRTLGLNAPGEASQADVGSPMADFMIDLTALKNWDGNDPTKLLRATGQYVYPINVDGETRTSVTIAKVRGEWKPAIFGSPDEAQARSQVRKSVASNAPGGGSPIVQVRVPAFNAVFVAQQTKDQLDFTPLESLPDLGIKAGDTEPAKQVLLKLQPIAKEMDPDVPH